MATISDITAVFELSIRLHRAVKTAPIVYAETLQTLNSLKRILKAIIDIVKRSEDLDGTYCTPVGPIDIRNSDRIEELEDDIIHLDGPIGNTIRFHVLACRNIMDDFAREAAAAGWRDLTKAATRSGGKGNFLAPFIQATRTIAATQVLPPRRMRQFEQSIKKHVDALQTYICLATARSQSRVEEHVVAIGRKIQKDHKTMFQLLEAIQVTVSGIAVAVPNSRWGPCQAMIEFDEPFGVLPSLPLALCDTPRGIFRLVATALKNTAYERDFAIYNREVIERSTPFANRDILELCRQQLLQVPTDWQAGRIPNSDLLTHVRLLGLSFIPMAFKIMYDWKAFLRLLQFISVPRDSGTLYSCSTTLLQDRQPEFKISGYILAEDLYVLPSEDCDMFSSKVVCFDVVWCPSVKTFSVRYKETPGAKRATGMDGYKIDFRTKRKTYFRLAQVKIKRDLDDLLALAADEAGTHSTGAFSALLAAQCKYEFGEKLEALRLLYPDRIQKDAGRVDPRSHSIRYGDYYLPCLVVKLERPDGRMGLYGVYLLN
ncbi:hypothetical protein BJ508DRAFT_110933 [Ascobolus immersus RN42]|uniref:Uncharacterized protein n=1 Tax=Ascobolus immersus RN42 TaxID=1160509 RepID=A0A3N4IBG7_ASCIM|nr:hypothetical protein BJ508DRAFT_110933 [Ascobolus immersus RN42]